MKKLSLFIISITASLFLTSQVNTTSVNSIGPTGGLNNTGVNTANPRTVLQSKTNSNYRNAGTAMLLTGDGPTLAPGLMFEELDSINSNTGLITLWNDNMMYFKKTGAGNYANSDMYMFVNPNLNVAIGNSAAQNKLHVQGGTRIDDLPVKAVNDRLVFANGSGDLRSLTSGTTSQYLRGDGTWAAISASGNTTNNCNTTNSLPRLSGTNTFGCSQVFDNGIGVGIGTQNPNGFMQILMPNNLQYRNLGTGQVITGNGGAPGLMFEESAGGNTGAITYWGNNMMFLKKTGAGNYAGTDIFMQADANSNLAIGNAAPQNKLHVQGGTRIDNLPVKAANDRLVFANGNGDLRSLTSGTTSQYLRGDGTWAAISASGNTTNNCNTNNSLPRLVGANTFGCSQVFDNGISVGIGTQNPNGFMQILMPNNLQYRNLGAGQVITGNGGAPGLLFEESAGGNTGAITYWGNNMMFLKKTGAGNYAGTDIFMQADANSNLAIGNAAPQNKLHVQGGTRIDNLPLKAANDRLVFANGSGDLRSLGAGTNTQFLRGDGTWQTIAGGGNTSNTCATINRVPRLTGTNTYGCSQIFDNGASVGINTTTPRTFSTTASYASTFGAPSNSTIARLDINGLTFTNSLVVSSDARLKKDIKQIENALNIVNRLNGVTYNWESEKYKERNLDNLPQAGFLAQELDKVFPNAVVQDENGFFAVNYNSVIPVLSNAIKELNAKVEKQNNAVIENEALKSDITILKEENQMMKEKFALLEKSLAVLCESGCAGLKDLGGKTNSEVNALFQSIPNPTDDVAMINYYLVKESIDAYITITTQDGKQLQSYKLEPKAGAGSVKVSLGSLAQGTYLYTLIAEGQVVDTKRLQIIK